MDNKYTQKQIEEIYGCKIEKISGKGIGITYIATCTGFDGDPSIKLFDTAKSSDLKELHSMIREAVHKRLAELANPKPSTKQRRRPWKLINFKKRGK